MTTATVHQLSDKRAPSLDPVIALTAGDMNAVNAVILERMQSKVALIPELTGDQRFFIAYGYSWQRKQREGALRAQLLTDEHSPAMYRVNGVVRNMDAWYKAST